MQHVRWSPQTRKQAETSDGHGHPDLGPWPTSFIYTSTGSCWARSPEGSLPPNVSLEDAHFCPEGPSVLQVGVARGEGWDHR